MARDEVGPDPETADLVALVVQGQDGLFINIIGCHDLHVAKPVQVKAKTILSLFIMHIILINIVLIHIYYIQNTN